MPRRARTKQPKSVETLTHEEARRRNLPSAEHQPLMREEEQSPVQVAYERRNRDLDPQLVWRGKDEQDWSDLVVNVPPLYIQERVHPKVWSTTWCASPGTVAVPNEYQTDMFADFNGLPSEDAKTEFYQHDANWSNRMILGDSLQVMASLAEREGLRGKVQCIYIDPPYGIKFNSNFQWSTTSRDVRDGNAAHITREPEQVKAFRDTWRDGIHSYLTYLRDRLTVARDLAGRLRLRSSCRLGMRTCTGYVRSWMRYSGSENFRLPLLIRQDFWTFRSYLSSVMRLLASGMRRTELSS